MEQISDVSDIPPATWATLEKALVRQKPLSAGTDVNALPTTAPEQSPRKCPVLVIDTLKLTPHASHFGIGQTLASMARIQPERTYIFGFPHRRTHECWVHACETLGQTRYSLQQTPPRWPQGNAKVMSEETKVRREVDEDFERWSESAKLEVSGWVREDATEGEMYWIRPAFDGLTITIERGQVCDDFYRQQ